MSRTKWVILIGLGMVALVAFVLLFPVVRAFVGATKSAIATTNAKIAADETTISIAGPAGAQIALWPNYTDGWLIVTLPGEMGFFPDYGLVQINEDVSVSSFFASDHMPIVCGMLTTYGTGLSEPYFIIILDDQAPPSPVKDYSTTFKTRDELAQAWLEATGTALPEAEPHNIER